MTGTAADAKEWLAGVFDRAAPTYDAVAGAYHDHFGARLVELAGVRPGDTVLDVGCGRGAVLLPAAERAGPAGRALGVDLSPEMVRLARERVEAAGVDAELRVDRVPMDIKPTDTITDPSHHSPPLIGPTSHREENQGTFRIWGSCS